MIRRVKFQVLEPVGPKRSFTEGSLVDLLFDIPYFFLAKIVPPIEVVNEVLEKGKVEAGMSGGCKWKPFQLDLPLYAKLVTELKQLGFLEIRPPDWVTTHSDWHTWCAELAWGIPALSSSQQLAEIDELNAQREAAIKRGNDELAELLLLQVNELHARHSRFIAENSAPEAKLPLFRRPAT